MAGETTALAAGSWRAANSIPTQGPAAALHTTTLSASFTTTDNQTNDVMEMGYLPEGITIVGVIVTATDMDTGGPTVVHKITVGSTDILTGLTNAGTGATTFNPLPTPYKTAAYDLVKVTSTTAATTAAAGTLSLRFVYF